MRIFSIIFVIIAFACNSNESTSSQNFDKLIQKLELIKGKKVIIDQANKPMDQIIIPEAVSKSDFIDFFNAYLKMKNLIAITRGDEILIKDMQEYYSRWTNDPIRALELYDKNKSPLLIKFTSEDCHACKLQDRMFFSEEKLFQELDKFILLEVNGWEFLEKPEDKKFQMLKEKLKSFKDQNLGSELPTLVLLSEKNSKIIKGHEDRWDDYWGILKQFSQ